MVQPLRLDPRMFIGPPFCPCPNCSAAEFGTLMISGRTLTRRCRSCWHTETTRLPKLRKKVVYLDQMAYSGMAKTLDPVWAAQVPPQDPFWGQLFDALDRAFKLQLIVCPQSDLHDKESALAREPAMLKAVYEHLANGTTFQGPTIIHYFQLSVALRQVLSGAAPRYDLDRGKVILGSPDEWMERLRISVNAGLDPDPAILRSAKDRSAAAMQVYFERWKTEKDKSFEDWYQLERPGHAVNYWLLFTERMKLMREVSSGAAPVSEDVWNPRIDAEVVGILAAVAQQGGVPDGDVLRTVRDFLFSDAAFDAPANDLTALLMAALARKAASGQVRPPSPGMWTDIRVISSYLPYCDAMFLDNECAGLLREEPLRTRVEAFGTRVFSAKSCEAFVEYVSELERAAGPDHLRLVEQVYGENWAIPYRNLLAYERERRKRKP